jgi:hypothetical protein
MAEVLGRVVASHLACPRGPDASHRIRVPRDWLARGAVIELELPRHLVCAACDGGGCDACERSGGVTLRERGAPADLVEVTLPSTEKTEAFVIRLPERGGLAPVGSDLPRGHLLVRVEPSESADPGVALVERPALPAARRVPSLAAPNVVTVRIVLIVTLVGLAILVIWLLFGHGLRFR